jgi:hypothetical protein
VIPATIRGLFALLESAAIEYVVLRGYLPLEELADSLDIDVYIARRDRRRATAALAQAGWFERRYQTGRYPHRFYDNFEVPGRVCTMLDVVYGLHYGDRLHALACAERVLETSELFEGVRVPHPWVALLTFAVHVLLDKEMLSENNARRGRMLWALCAERAEEAAVLQRDFGAAAHSLAERFGQSVGGGEHMAFEVLRRDAIGLDCLRARPALARVHGLWVRLRRRLIRPLRLAVLGMDGAGKTTLIEHAVTMSSPLPIGSAYLGHNHYATRTCRWLLARIEALIESGRSESLRVRLLEKARALWWPVELFARMRRAERGRAVVLYDRYPFPRYDRAEEPTTVPGYLMAAYERLWTALLPAADALVFCDGAPEVIWARKQEYPYADFLGARSRCLRLFEEFPRERHIIMTDEPLAVSTAHVTELLRNSIALRRRLYRECPTRGEIRP